MNTPPMHELDKTLEGPALNTDREIWRERPGDYYADSIHVTASGGIGIDCGGMVYTLPVREWHRLASSTSAGVTEEQTPRVKQLEWVAGSRTGSYTAHGLGILYAIDTDHECAVLAKWEGSSVLKSAHETADAAKDFAQSSETARILAALEASRSPVSQKEAVPVDEDDMPERIWAGDFDASGFGHCVVGPQGGLYAEYVRADLAAPAGEPATAADKIISEIEQRFPNWRGYRDLTPRTGATSLCRAPTPAV